MSLILAALLAAAPMSSAGDSLYEERRFQALTADRKARAPGDLITILVMENASASSSANSGGGRSTDVNGALTGPGGTRGAGLRLSSDMDGHGATEREGRLLAQLTVAVTDVAPNGDLSIAGEQLLEINNEKQQIKLEGRVRPQDISETNTVLSNRVGQARISYAGSGEVSSRQRASWLQRLLTFFGL